MFFKKSGIRNYKQIASWDFDLTMITLFTLVLFLYKNKVRKIWKKRNYKFFEINDKIKIN